jgi:p-aminobenzoyl-glutamate transporter AbgT
MLFKPNLGEEFPLDVHSLNARRGLLEEITRSYLTALVVPIAVVFLVGAAILGLVKGSFEHLGAVWNALAAPLGAIVGYYLPGRRREG